MNKELIDAYKKGVDFSLIKENLKLSPLERIKQAEQMLEFACKLQNSKKVSKIKK